MPHDIFHHCAACTDPMDCGSWCTCQRGIESNEEREATWRRDMSYGWNVRNITMGKWELDENVEHEYEARDKAHFLRRTYPSWEFAAQKILPEIPVASTSYPYLALARSLGADYGAVLSFSDGMMLTSRGEQIDQRHVLAAASLTQYQRNAVADLTGRTRA